MCVYVSVHSVPSCNEDLKYLYEFWHIILKEDGEQFAQKSTHSGGQRRVHTQSYTVCCENTLTDEW